MASRRGHGGRGRRVRGVWTDFLRGTRGGEKAEEQRRARGSTREDLEAGDGCCMRMAAGLQLLCGQEASRA